MPLCGITFLFWNNGKTWNEKRQILWTAATAVNREPRMGAKKMPGDRNSKMNHQLLFSDEHFFLLILFDVIFLNFGIKNMTGTAMREAERKMEEYVKATGTWKCISTFSFLSDKRGIFFSYNCLTINFSENLKW